MSNSDLLKENGWEIECESPFEIRHSDGSFATMNAAYMILHVLKTNDKNEVAVCDHDFISCGTKAVECTKCEQVFKAE